jgi:hypothetical protein
MTWLWRPFLAALVLSLLVLGWSQLPLEWIVPVAYGVVLLAIWVTAFLWAFLLRK